MTGSEGQSGERRIQRWESGTAADSKRKRSRDRGRGAWGRGYQAGVSVQGRAEMPKKSISWLGAKLGSEIKPWGRFSE